MVGQNRPARTYQTGRVTLWLRRITMLATAVLTAILLAFYPSLPETIPTHFTLLGEPDAYGPRKTILLLAVIMGGLLAGMGWLSRKPHAFNYPLVVTDTNAQSVYREGERTLVWTTTVFLIYLGTVIAVFGWNGSVLIGIGVAVMACALIVGIRRMITASHIPTDEPASPSATQS